MKSLLCAGVLALAGVTPSLAQAPVELPRGLSLAEIRSTITSIEGMTITKEETEQNETAFVISVERVPFVFGVRCLEGGTNCVSIAMIGFLPSQFANAAARLNEYNAVSNFGWLATESQTGLVLVRNSALLAGNTGAGLRANLYAYIGFYAVIGDALAKGAGGSTISLEGVDISPRERIVDASHLPASSFELSPSVRSLISSEEIEKGLSKILGDAQTYGRLRKIANDVYGQ